MVSDPVAASDPKEVPDVPPAITEAAAAGRLILFVGAGVSRLAGGPSWEQAAENAFKELVAKGLISFGEAEQLRMEHPKKKLSIAMDISESANSALDFSRIFCPPDERLNAQLYKDLYSLSVPIVTTNYDEGFDRQTGLDVPQSASVPTMSTLEQKELDVSRKTKGASYFDRRDLTIEKLLQPGSVIHLHGSVRDHKTMVVSTRQYLDHYRDHLVQAFLRGLFEGDYTILFVGYGLDEEEVIEYVTQKRRRDSKPEEKHFWLYPHLAYHEDRFKHLSNYYKNHCNVKLVKFSIDRTGYSQMGEVIAKWIETLRMKVRAPEFLDKIRLIDKVT